MTNQQYNKIKMLLGVKELSEQIKQLNIDDANNFIKWLESSRKISLNPTDLSGTEAFHRWLND